MSFFVSSFYFYIKRSKAFFSLKQERPSAEFFAFVAAFLLGLLGLAPIDLLLLSPEDEKASVLIPHISRSPKTENFSPTVHVHEHVLKDTPVRLASIAQDIAAK